VSFKKKKYEIVRGAISSELAEFIFNYFLMQRDATAFLIKYNVIKDKGAGDLFGTWQDPQSPNTFSRYGDHALETLQLKLLPIVRKITERNLIPCYAYGRIYKKGDELIRHVDRDSCETSCSLHLGGDPWKIFLDPTGKSRVPIDMKPGDMLIYCGSSIEHWRKPFKGKVHAQAFVH
jgi:hypothetical protein